MIALDYAGYKSEGETKVTDVMEENTTTLRDDYLNYILSKKFQAVAGHYPARQQIRILP